MPQRTCEKCGGSGLRSVLVPGRSLAFGALAVAGCVARTRCDECGGKGTVYRPNCQVCADTGVIRQMDKGFPWDETVIACSACRAGIFEE